MSETNSEEPKVSSGAFIQGSVEKGNAVYYEDTDCWQAGIFVESYVSEKSEKSEEIENDE